MCTLDTKFFYLPTVPLFLAAANSLVGAYTGRVPVKEEFVLYIAGATWLITLMHFAFTATQGLCKQLGINALTIPYPNKATKIN